MAIKDLFDKDLASAIPTELQHKVRVASNLCSVMSRQSRMQQEAEFLERRALAELLERDDTVEELNQLLFRRLRSSGNEEFQQAARAVLLDITEADLKIAKPGYYDYHES